MSEQADDPDDSPRPAPDRRDPPHYGVSWAECRRSIAEDQARLAKELDRTAARTSKKKKGTGP